jgi:hypothetical protein
MPRWSGRLSSPAAIESNFGFSHSPAMHAIPAPGSGFSWDLDFYRSASAMVIYAQMPVNIEQTLNKFPKVHGTK